LDIPYYRQYELPWSADLEQEWRFRRLLAYVLGVALLLGIVWPWLPAPDVEPYAVEEIPPRLAKFVLEQKPPPPAPPARREQPEPEAEAVAEQPPERAAEPEPVPQAPRPDPAELARERAQAALLPFTEDLVALRENDALESVANNRPLSASPGAAARNERSMITSRAGASSAGINTAAMSRDTGGTGLAARAITQVESPVEAVGDTGGGARRTGVSGKPSRSREEIELVFDENKAGIFALYNRALREDPTLEGKLVLRLTIAPSGEVTFCEVVSSELGNEELERRLVQRVKMFRFEARDVETITTTKPIDFFPA
jgi:periplasmic protein TonB